MVYRLSISVGIGRCDTTVHHRRTRLLRAQRRRTVCNVALGQRVPRLSVLAYYVGRERASPELRHRARMGGRRATAASKKRVLPGWTRRGGAECPRYVGGRSRKNRRIERCAKVVLAKAGAAQRSVLESAGQLLFVCNRPAGSSSRYPYRVDDSTNVVW